MRKKSNSLLLALIAGVLLLFVALPCYYFAGVTEGIDRLPEFLLSVSYSTVFNSVYIIGVALTLKNQFKVYEVMKETNDSVKYEVNRKGLRGVLVSILLAIVVQSLFTYLILANEDTANIKVAIVFASLIVLAFDAYAIFQIRSAFNFRLLLGEKFIVVSDKKGKMYTFEINSIVNDHEYHLRKNPAVRHVFEFSNGSFDIYNSSYRALCLIAYLKAKLDSKKHGFVNPVDEYYEGFPKKYNISTGSNAGFNKDSINFEAWVKADKETTKNVRSNSIVESILGLFIVGLVAVIIYGVIYSLVDRFLEFDYLFECSVVYIIVVLMFWAYNFRQSILCSFSEIYCVEGKVVRKHTSVSPIMLADPDVYVDVAVAGDVICNVPSGGLDYRELKPGRSKVFLVKSKLSAPKIYTYD